LLAALGAAGGQPSFGGPDMSWLNNLKISFKIGLIVVLMAVVTIGAIGFAAMRMKAIGDS
jgi:hypothetical protein